MAANTDLLTGIRLNDAAMVRRALDNGANMHINMHVVVRHSAPEIVRTLIEFGGADAHGPIKDSLTPLMVACVAKRWDVARILMDAGADPLLDAGKGSALHIAAMHCDAGFMGDLLSHVPADVGVNLLSRDGVGALHYAAQKDNVDATLALLTADADTELVSPTKDGSTPLLLAVRMGALRTTLALLSAGANVNVYNAKGDTPLHLCSEHEDDTILRALVRAGADVNARNAVDGFTPLHVAVYEKRTDHVRTLIELGADPTLPIPSTGATPLDFARERRNMDAVAALVAATTHFERRHAAGGMDASARRRQREDSWWLDV